jgi:hypothetical protein
MAGGCSSSPRARDDKRIKLPEFDGTGNVDGFIKLFTW